ncbi:hypothetical protein ACFYY9_16760 [Streptomyces nigra]|uniref:hypothetical protein n=1 Tax=Streptomyces nigra TaxID=1827580 RepID=UPI0036B063DD
MSISLGRRLGITAIAATSAVIFSATPALAHTNITIGTDQGRMTFIDDGDVFEVCDTKADGAGVVGKLWFNSYIGGDWYVEASGDDGGDDGCDKFAHNVEDTGEFQMRLYWTGPGYDKEIARSRTFNE